MEKKRFVFLIGLVLIINLLIGYSLYSEKLRIEEQKRKEEEAIVTIPKVSFWGDLSNISSKKEKRKIFVKYESKDKKFETHALIKWQGTSSLSYTKKNYTISFYKNDNYEEEKNIDVGFGSKENIYCLKANWIDKTHARNIVTARMMSKIQEKYNLFIDTPNNGLIDGYPVEIYLNGEFLGLYTLNIPKSAWMFNMDENNKNHIVFAAEGWDRTNLFKEEAEYGKWELEVGEENEENLAKLNRLINFVDNSDDETFKKDFDKYLNLDATINYLIMMEFANLNDNIAKNMLIVTYDGKVWYPSLYDLDTSWGTKWDGKEKVSYNNFPKITNSKLWKRVLEHYSSEIAERYFELRKDILTKENVMKEFNDFYDSIPEETWTKENERWENIPGYDYSQIEEFLDVRIPLMDELMKDRLEQE